MIGDLLLWHLLREISKISHFLRFPSRIALFPSQYDIHHEMFQILPMQ
ncbi:unnamed protein product [Penicillium camemberti]|uniref:Str. FM013 n=1 Tax=Penicillium camemberti (strain FM 013) TaxID=1429867 RepID=A0A0G4PR02_PENC3|nr:unnamed protein product [Penicillium camemberti]